MIISSVVALLLLAAVFLGWLRLGLWWYAAPVTRRSRLWRIALLAIGQGIAALLLYLALFPPEIGAKTQALTIATRGAPLGPLHTSSRDVIAMPEAQVPAGIPTAPDLGTALREHPGVQRLRIIGEGLEPRDRDAAEGVTLDFVPPPLPRGLTALSLPAHVAAGGEFRIGGTASGAAGTAEMLDPSGERVAAAPLDASGSFILSGAARLPGPALFHVRLRDAGGKTIEEAAAPVLVDAEPPIRVLYLAGTPSPEVKYWHRWAVDSGVDANVRQTVGAGLALGDPMPSIDAATLAHYDLLIVDERSWAALSAAERTAVTSAIRAGLGILLRPTGPLPAEVRASWGALGVTLAEGADTTPVQAKDVGEVALTRRVLSLDQRELVPILSDAGGTPLAAWRAFGRGRVGIWSLTDDFGLVTAGQGERFGAWWAETLGALARARMNAAPSIGVLPRVGVRTAICGTALGAKVTSPDQQVTTLIPDAAADGCSGFWPQREGWHMLNQPDRDTPFYVYSAAALPNVRAIERRDATLALVGLSTKSTTGIQRIRSASWPWMIGFLLVMTLLWSLERAPLGRQKPIVAA